ncbi:hypothetical protein [Candidatus Thiosymbion oneisti]|uniref:hypothetical protein n=1 Tax=Candidatus Thiosymbion oneisti TaxID=589554 RepID=UPI000B7E7CFA|nr:hypothetical protein [Candidatus Thiosymbion oneisti]
MKELINELSQHSANLPNIDARVFLEFKYPEIRELLKHFLTLISAALMFSVAFAEKIVNFETASNVQKGLLIGSWGTLIIALGCCGIGLYTIYLSAEKAFAQMAGQTGLDFSSIVGTSYIFQDLSGILFGISMCLLVFAAIAGKF